MITVPAALALSRMPAMVEAGSAGSGVVAAGDSSGGVIPGATLALVATRIR